MDTLVIALGPAFAAGFAVQRLLEILDPILEKLPIVKDYKKMTLAIVSLVVGLVLAFGVGLRVLEPLGVAASGGLDALVTALIVSAGTEGFNSIMKFLGYAKEEKKADAAGKKANAKPEDLRELQLAA